VAENEYRLILNEIKALEEEIVKMEFDKAQKCEKIKEMEKKCISIEAELKQFFDDNAKLRKQLDENNTQSVTFQLKKEEIENLLKKDSEKLSFAHHKVFSLYCEIFSLNFNIKYC
jgi:septal ring factor EnvC (AmiA/AmiB activator)